MWRYLTALILLINVTGCSHIYSRLSYEFEKLPSSPNINYETGAEDLAKHTEEHLHDLIADVETFQFRRFKSREEIQIYLFNDKKRYSNYSLASARSRGSATTNEVYISPIIRDRIDTFSSILKHELSHVHIRQFTGTWNYVRNIPGWFLEGLAVETSNGGGAENVSDEEAIAFIKKGQHFTPRDKGGFLSHNSAHDYDLKPHMYYRQAGLFVRFLKTQNPQSFKLSYISLTDGASFDSVWETHYDQSIAELWEHFLKSIHEETTTL